MRIEIKQGKHGKWRWIVRRNGGRVLFLSAVNDWHDTHDECVGAARTALRDAGWGLAMLGRSKWLRELRKRWIERESWTVPYSVVYHQGDEGDEKS